ncbi:uncharacterized protein LOC117298930 [Asterias rubens]|uniref:uncharacterized protein LOC117298930 n=1 Tax=Asterias rubens TaxID=7604 RepID=UPI0014556A7D|nr:uncharacterized protein LOC117298930 [Asterias rubens]
MSKAQKKNQKRSGKKPHDGGGFEIEENITGGPTGAKKTDPVLELREQLAQAKTDKNHDLANKLRQQLWIAQDLAAGYKPKIDSEDKDSQEALAKAVETITVSATKGATASAMSTSSLGEEERKLKTLHKKLDQIQKLKKKQEQGVKLEANQIEKMKTEDSILEEIQHLEKLLSIPMKR